MSIPRLEATLKLVGLCGHKGLALDIGCGNNAKLLHKLVKNYVGLDIDLATLKRQGVDVVCASGAKIPFRNQTFELVLCTETLEHFQKPDRTISEITRVLITGGFAVVSVPSLSLPQMLTLWIAYKLGKLSAKPFQSTQHQREYTKLNISPHFETVKNLFKMFEEHHLHIREVSTVLPLYTRLKIYHILAKLEPLLGRLFSKMQIGHYTVFRAENLKPQKCMQS